MARYASFKYGSGTKYGVAGLTAPQLEERGVLGGYAPWLPGTTVPYRAACCQLYRFDPGTWTAGDVFPDFLGGSRAASFDGIFQTERLSFTVNDPSAYLGGARTGWVAVGQYVQPRWTIVGAAGDVTVSGNVYVVVSPPSADDDAAGGGPLTVEAIDWLQSFLRRTSSASGLYTGRQLNTFLDAAEETDFPHPGAAASAPGGPYGWADLIAAMLWPGPNQLQVDAWLNDLWPYLPEPDDDPFLGMNPMDVAFALTTPGQRATGYDLVRWASRGGRGAAVRVVYAANGVPYLRLRAPRYQSGYTLSCDDDAKGGIPLPWERLERTLGDPSYTRLHYWVQQDPPPAVTPAEGGGSEVAFTFSPVEYGTTAVSAHPLFPHDEALRPTQEIVDQGLNIQAAGFAHHREWAEWAMRHTLGDADQVRITVDSAIPCHELGTEIRVAIPEKQIDAWYEIVSVNQPLDVAAASWTGAWRGEA